MREKIRDGMIKRIRPGFGGHPRIYTGIIGSIARKDIKYGTPVFKHDFTKEK